MKPCFLSDSVLVGATLTADSTAAGFPVANITDRRPYTQWVSGSTATQTITAACTVEKTADTVAIAGHNLAGCVLTVQTSPDGVTWTDVISFTPSSNLATALPFGYIAGGKRFGKTATALHWALKIAGATDAPAVGVLMIGSRLELPSFPVGKFTPETETAEFDDSVSKEGFPLGSSIKYRSVSEPITIDYPGADWTRLVYKPFHDANLGLPMFFCWELDRWPESVVFGRIAGKYAPSFDALGRVARLPITFNGIRA